MTHEDIRKALLDESRGPREVRTNDGRVYLVHGVERWAIGGGRLVIMWGPKSTMEILSIRNIASIGLPASRRRSRRA